MSPRPRLTSDAEILAAAARVMQRRSPVELTLADVAREAGVVPATLIQRFGTKRALLLANCRAWTADVASRFDAARAKYRSPLQTLVWLYAESSGFVATPESIANHLAYVQIDLTDAEFHRVLLAQSETMHKETKKLLEEAVVLRELRPCHTAELADLIQDVNSGAMLGWAIYRKGSLASWIRRSLHVLLRPYRHSKNRSNERKKLHRRKRNNRPVPR
jgi:AcrR family transcriptional regulator